MTRDDGAHSLGDAIPRQVLENIPEDPAVDYLELLRNTGMTKTDLDRALADLENLGVINKKDGQSGPLLEDRGRTRYRVVFVGRRRQIPFSIKAHRAAIDPRRRDGGLPGWPGRPPQDSPNGLGRSDAPGRPLSSSGTGRGGRRSVVRIMG